MCGRAYHTYTDEELSVRYRSRAKIKIPKLEPNYNLSPTQLAPILYQGADGLEISPMHWGLIPPWSQEFKTEFSTINARSEGVFESKLYSKSILRTRCIFPLSGFIEWKRSGAKKQPFAIYHSDRMLMSCAAIYDRWVNPANPEDVRHSFSVLTTASSSFMSEIHDRMPVILPDVESEDRWLNESQNRGDLEKLLIPLRADTLATHPISPLINSPKNNSLELLDPYTPAQGTLGI
jgi:putative SOS response-associated peptidase YedK